MDNETINKQLVKAGDGVQVQWGKWRVSAVVTRVSGRGIVYAKRWNKRRGQWTAERRLYRWRGIWATEPLSNSDKDRELLAELGRLS